MGKTLNYNLIIAGLLTILGVEGVCLYNLIKKENSVNPQSNRRLQRIEMQSENLVLNRDDEVYFITNKNEEQGINDIRKIINNSEYEEAWLYFPEKQIWYDVGIRSEIDKSEVNISGIEEIIQKNKGKKEFIFYHNHPGNKSIHKFPSLNDLRNLIYQIKEFPDYEIKHKICSQEGIMEYFPAKEILEEIKSDKIDTFKYFYQHGDTLEINANYIKLNFKPFENKKCPSKN